MKDFTSWKQFSMDDLKLKKNWARGRCAVRELIGHTKRSVNFVQVWHTVGICYS